MTPREYKLGGSWGCHVSWGLTAGSDLPWYLRRQVYGHHPRRPRVGDVLLVEMRSGEVHRARFVSVDYCRDPEDMFFAEIRWSQRWRFAWELLKGGNPRHAWQVLS